MNLFKNLGLLLGLVNGEVLLYNWDLTQRLIAPDNYGLDMILINHEFPGPTIEATTGDTIIVKLTNLLTKSFTMHWHGMTQKGTVSSDGVPFITQPPIAPNTSYIYKFNVDSQIGTWWYHAHTGLDAEHAFGALVVKDKKENFKDLVKFNPIYNYDDERILILSELWHKSLKELVDGLTTLPFRFVGSSDSVLINGKTYQQWLPNGKDNSSLPFNSGYYVMNVKQNKTYRLRLIGANGLALVKFQIPGHKLLVIEADGTFVDPIEVDYVQISPGQRYSVLVRMNQKVDNYYGYAQRLETPQQNDNGKFIVHYEGAKDARPLKTIPGPNISEPEPLTEWVENQLKTSKWYLRGLNDHFDLIPKHRNSEIILNVTNSVNPQGVPAFSINNIVNKPRNSTLLKEIKQNTYRPTPGVYDINVGDDVQIIIQHFRQANGPVGCQVHPWHLHGHTFYIVGRGPGIYKSSFHNPKIDAFIKSTKKIPIFRDIITIYPKVASNTTASISKELALESNIIENEPNIGNEEPVNGLIPCGWYAIRFKSNNPGVWFMHCHINAHLVMGKFLVLNERAKRCHPKPH